MCREGAWAELTVQVTSGGVIRSRMHGFKHIKKVLVLYGGFFNFTFSSELLYIAFISSIIYHR